MKIKLITKKNDKYEEVKDIALIVGLIGLIILGGFV